MGEAKNIYFTCLKISQNCAENIELSIYYGSWGQKVCVVRLSRQHMQISYRRGGLSEHGLSDRWVIDSAATSTWEIGNSPDKRGQKLMKSKGIPMSHVARQIKPEDYHRFDFIFGMDEDNLENLRHRKPTDAKCEIDFLGSFDPQEERIIHDPYTGTMDDFVHVYEQCLRCCEAFLKQQS